MSVELKYSKHFRPHMGVSANANINIRGDLNNNDGLLSNVCGIAAVGSLGYGSYLYFSGKSDIKALLGGLFTGCIFGCASLALRKDDKSEREKERQHEKEMAHIKHPSSSSPDRTIPCDESTLPALPSCSERKSDATDMPCLGGVFENVLTGCPEALQPAALVSFLAESAALIFSRCRAEYLDGKMHSPNIQVAVEAQSGAGKGQLKNMFDTIFKRIIEYDRQKLNEQQDGRIIQCVGSTISDAKFVDILANNQDTHLFCFEPEVSAFVQDIKDKSKGLRYDHVLKAFDNDEVHHMSKAKKTKQGSYKVFMNYVVTGTPHAFEGFISKQQVECGIASRIIHASVETNGQLLPKWEMPTGAKLDTIRSMVDDYRTKYCYTTVGDRDVPAAETVLDLSYVNDALKTWLDGQVKLADKEGNRARRDNCRRIACIAFHCSIVAHMYYEDVLEELTQGAVLELTLWVANYTMRRFLAKYGDVWNSVQHQYEAKQQKVVPTMTEEEKQEKVIELYQVPDVDDKGQKVWGYSRIADAVGWLKADGKPDKDRVRNYLVKSGYK